MVHDKKFERRNLIVLLNGMREKFGENEFNRKFCHDVQGASKPKSLYLTQFFF